MGAPQNSVDFADVECAQFGDLVDRHGLGDSQRVDSQSDPPLGLGDDPISLKCRCCGLEDLLTDPRLPRDQGLAAPDKLVLSHQPGLLTNGA